MSTKGWIVPSDWDGVTYTPVILCCPASSEWLSVLGGAVSQMGNAWSYDADTGDFLEARQIGLEVYNSMSGCSELITAINSLKVAVTVNACGCPVGQGDDTDDATETGPVPAPIGDIVYEAPAAVQDRKCKASNLIHETLRDVMNELDGYNVDDMGVLGLALVVSIVVGVIGSAVATPLVGIMLAVAGATAVFAARLVGVSVSLANIVSVMDANQQDLVCELYISTQASVARTDYLNTLMLNGVTALEAELVELLMTNALMDILYFDTAETAAFWPTYTGAIDCTQCDQTGCPLDLVDGTGTITYDNVPFVISSVPESTYHVIRIYNSGGPCVGFAFRNWCGQFTAHTLFIGGSWNRTIGCWTGGGIDTDSYPGSFPALHTDFSLNWIDLASPDPFTITMKLDYPLPDCVGGPDDGCV